MALLRYMKPIGGLPGPREVLSSSIPTQAIAEVNKEVQKAVGTADGGNMVITSGTALLYVPKLLSMPVNMVQLQPHIIRRSWRNR